jgi:predicted nicotinamide N-methyase
MQANWTEAKMRAEIHAVTRPSHPTLVPELTLRLVTDDCDWWRLRPEELEARGIPEPFWAFAWAGGQALARYILDHPESVRDRSVIDFGCGGGIVALAALKAGARFVDGTELDPWALEAARINLQAYEKQTAFWLEDWTARDLPQGSVLLLGDMHYEAALTARLLDWFQSLETATILVGDPNRGFLQVEEKSKAESKSESRDSGSFECLKEYRVPMDSDGTGLMRGRARVLRYIHRSRT